MSPRAPVAREKDQPGRTTVRVWWKGKCAGPTFYLLFWSESPPSRYYSFFWVFRKSVTTRSVAAALFYSSFFFFVFFLQKRLGQRNNCVQQVILRGFGVTPHALMAVKMRRNAHSWLRRQEDTRGCERFLNHPPIRRPTEIR
ncbi:unnamed protein product [Ixodes persulcatus]